MKIAILGYSGSGKSTLAEALGKSFSCPVLHMDTIHWLPGWKMRDREEQMQLLGDFLDENTAWVIDGNYSKNLQKRRLEEADAVVMLLFGRIPCLARAFKRYVKFKGKTRPDIGEGCGEKFDREFIRWILRDGRTKRMVKHYRDIESTYAKKVYVIKNQRQLDRFVRRFTSSYPER